MRKRFLLLIGLLLCGFNMVLPQNKSENMIEKNKKIYVAGHNGMVGSAVVRELKRQNYNNIVTRTSHELDLSNQKEVNEFFKNEKPDVVILTAAKVGGIEANRTDLTGFLMKNLS